MTKLHNEGKGHQRGAAMRRRFGILRPRQHQNPLHVPLYAVYQVPRYDEIKYIQNSPPGYQVGSCFALTCRDIYISIKVSAVMIAYISRIYLVLRRKNCRTAAVLNTLVSHGPRCSRSAGIKPVLEETGAIRLVGGA